VIRNGSSLYCVDQSTRKIIILKFISEEDVQDYDEIEKCRTFFQVQKNVFNEFVITNTGRYLNDWKHLVGQMDALSYKLYDINDVLSNVILSGVCNGKVVDLSRIIIGSKVYDTRNFHLCSIHLDIFEFKDFKCKVSTPEKKCQVCKWLESRQLPFFQTYFEQRLDKLPLIITREDLQDIILFFDNITLNIPDIIYDIANVIFHKQIST
jgi:hypothetical protein